MSAVVLAMVWLSVTLAGVAALSSLERRGRVATRLARPVLAPPRASWGGDPVHPPSRALTARLLAGIARIVRQRTRVTDHRLALRGAARAAGLVSLGLGLAMLPILSTWGGQIGPVLVPLDLEHGLAAIVLVLGFQAFARTTQGLSERSPWSRMGAARQSSRAIASVALLAIVLAPLALDAGSLRLHALVVDQARPLEALLHLATSLRPESAAAFERFAPPAWNLFAQPITAALFLPALALWIASPRVDDPATGAIDAVGAGLDADPIDLYWTRFDARLSAVFGAGLFVTLFLGAGHVPFFEPLSLAARLQPYYGEAVPALLVTTIGLASFVGKLLVVLAFTNRLARSAASARDDRNLQMVIRRLMPLAWANLLLVAGIALWLERWLAGGGG